MNQYSYEQCLSNAHKVNWRIDEVLGGRNFDLSRRWLPSALSGADGIAFLDEDLRRKLSHVEMGSYAHLFGYVEEFIAPQIAELCIEREGNDRPAFDALSNFLAEEVKHMHLFRMVRGRVDATLGVDLELVDGERETADYVLNKSTGAVLLLTACIEWFTQRHYLECFDEGETLDPFTKHIFKSHWQEEAQHAQLDHLEALRAFESMDLAQRDRSIDDLIELVSAVDGLLQKQSDLDTRNFQAYAGLQLSPDESEQVRDHVLRAKRHTFLVTGVTHPRFQELFLAVTTPEQQDRVGAALASLLPELAGV